MSAEGYINRWWRVVGGLSMNLALGSLYAWSVFVAPLEKEFGWKRADTSMIFTIAVFVFGLAFILAGRLQDKKGPFWISVIGDVLVSVGVVLSAWTTTLAWVCFWFGAIGGSGNGFGYATPIPVMAKWFPDRRGLAVGLAVAGYGGGSAIFGPLAGNWLIPTYGWRTTFQVLGVIFLIMTLAGAFLLKNPPVGWKPAGWTPAPAAKAAATTYEFSPGEVLKTPAFYLMWIAYCLGTSAGLMVISQLVPFARSRGVPLALATTAIFIGAVAMPILAHTGGIEAIPIFLFVTVFIVYYCYGTQLSVNASTTSDFWGTKNAGINYGLLFTAWGVAGVIVPRIGGKLFDTYKDYKAAFYTAAVLSVIALVCELLAKRPTPPATASA